MFVLYRNKIKDMRPVEGIATDSAHSMKNGITRFRAVDLKTGDFIFSNDIGNKTINIGEFLGVVGAVKYIIENNYLPGVIYTDSITAITWFRNKRTASSKKYHELKQAEVYLKVFASEVDTIQVLHWDNKKWGEIPADYGNKASRK